MKRFALFLMTVLISAAAFARPGQVLLIRHAEKGSDSDPHLSEKGRLRAQKLVNFFINNRAMNEYGPPVGLFAAAPRNHDSSLRSIETLTPLSKALQVAINVDYEADELKKVTEVILKSPRYEGRTVVVAWAHDELPELAGRLGVDDPPRKWKKKRFDRVWKITFRPGRGAKLVDLPQELLPGDSDQNGPDAAKY